MVSGFSSVAWRYRNQRWNRISRITRNRCLTSPNARARGKWCDRRSPCSRHFQIFSGVAQFLLFYWLFFSISLWARSSRHLSMVLGGYLCWEFIAVKEFLSGSMAMWPSYPLARATPPPPTPPDYKTTGCWLRRTHENPEGEEQIENINIRILLWFQK